MLLSDISSKDILFLNYINPKNNIYLYYNTTLRAEID